VLDVSNSMDEENKLKLMKKNMRRFVDSLHTDTRVGIMTFSVGASMILPFCSPAEKSAINASIDKLQAGGTTNGDLALRKVSRMIDSVSKGGRCHIIMATDGVFEISAKTKKLADSSFARNNASRSFPERFPSALITS
jgi:Ca-activated chloride channel family protein